MPIEHVNRRGDSYYLHQGATKTGKPMWFFSKKVKGKLAAAIPDGYEVYENANCQVFLRVVPPKLIADAEIKTVEDGIRQFAKLRLFIVEAKQNTIVVYTADQESEPELERMVLDIGFVDRRRFEKVLEQSAHYTAMMRFTLEDDARRLFSVERWCFRGRIDNWVPLIGGVDDLPTLVKKYIRHLSEESFFDLI